MGAVTMEALLDSIAADLLRDVPQNALPPSALEALRAPTLQALQNAASALVAERHFAAAEKTYLALVEYPGIGPWVNIGLAKIAASRNEWARAASIWEQCLRSFAERTEPWWFIEYARVERMQRRHAAAEAILRNGLERFPASGRLEAGLADQFGQQGDSEACFAAWQVVFEKFEQTAESWWFVQFAVAARKRGEPALAESILRRCRSRFPAFAAAVAALADLLGAQDRLQEAASTWQELIGEFADQLQPAWFTELAKVERKLGNLAIAEAHLRRCLQAFPGHAGSHAALADFLQTVKRNVEAITMWRSTIAAFADAAQPWWFLCHAGALRAVGDSAAADAVLADLNARFPNSPAALTRHAEAAAQLGAWQLALERWSVCAEKAAGEQLAQCLRGQAMAYVQLKRIDAALACWQQLISQFPDYIPGQLSFARACKELGDWPQLEQIMAGLIARHPQAATAEWHAEHARSLFWQGEHAAASRAIQAFDLKFPESPLGCQVSIEFCYHIDLGVDILLPEIEAGLRRFPEDRFLLAEHVRALLASGRPQEAEAVTRRLLAKGDDFQAIVSFWRVTMDANGEASLQFPVTRALQEQDWDLDAGLALGMFLLQLWRPWATEAALGLFEVLVRQHPGYPALNCAIIKAHIALRRVDLALDAIDRLPEPYQLHEAIELRAWAAAERGEHEAARRLWQGLLPKLYVRAIHSPKPDLVLVSQPAPAAVKVTAFTNIRNEMRHLPAYLAHHRRLGVGRFVIVDNMSSDGGPDFLKAQPDVILYRTEDGFQASGAGMRWVNVLQERHCADGWCLYCDADEALIYPGWETTPIERLVAYLESEKAEAMAGFMLDLYPERLVDAQGEPADLSNYRYYDSDYYWAGEVRPPYLQPVGGVRWRLFGVNEMLQKIPLIRHVAGQYINPHSATPLRFASVSAVLLHFKLLNLVSRLKQPGPGMGGNPFIANRNADLMRRHVRYAARMEKLLQADLRQPGLTETLDDSLVLADRGLMQAPAAFRRWLSATPQVGSELQIASEIFKPNVTTGATLSDLYACYDDLGHFNYSLHISRDPAFLYVNNPKCGCTTVKASINRWYAAFHEVVVEYGSMADIHNRNANPLLSPNKLGADAARFILHDPNVFRFTLLREPISRLASAYSNKLSWDSSERRTFNTAAGRPKESVLSFATFVSMIHGDKRLRNLNEHWLPQFRQIAAEFIPYDFICLQETLDEDLLNVRKRLFPGLSLGVFETRERFPSNRSGSSEIVEAATPDDLELIRQAYAEDFILYESTKQNHRVSMSSSSKH